MSATVIVTRHAATVEWLRAEVPELADAPVLASATADDVRGRIVYGNVPLFLAEEAAEVRVVEFTGAPPRGAEYGIEEMRAAGARISTYTVVNGGVPWKALRDVIYRACLEGAWGGSDAESLNEVDAWLTETGRGL